jgi:glycosyltransferase involved in cell wall biosynthesis
VLGVRQILSRPLDADARACADFISSLPRTTVLRRELWVEDTMPSIFRAAADLFRDSRADLLHTVGEPALTAAALVWRGPILHSPCKRVTRAEARQLKLLGRRVRVASVDETLSRSLRHAGVSDLHITDLRPPFDETEFVRPRDDLRESLGVGPEVRLVLAPGHITQISGHRLAYHVAAVLNVRDPSIKLLVSGRGSRHLGLERIAAGNRLGRLLISARHLSDRELARCADVGMVCPQGPAEVLPIADLMREGVPIVAGGSWAPELIGPSAAIGVRLPESDAGHARPLAEAVLNVLATTPDQTMLDAARRRAALCSPDVCRRDWVSVLRSVSAVGSAQPA